MSAAEIVTLLTRRGQTAATAESCTGGLIGAAITGIAGASAVFKGGVIAYANEVKHGLLGVCPTLLQTRGAVSEEVTGAMAEGARRLFDTTWAVAVSGVAGPDGGTREKPVGLVWIALSGPDGTEVQRRMFGGERAAIRAQTVDAALCLLLERAQRHGAAALVTPAPREQNDTRSTQP